MKLDVKRAQYVFLLECREGKVPRQMLSVPRVALNYLHHAEMVIFHRIIRCL